MEKVIFTKNTLDYFDNLVFTLFSENYFAYEESAQKYVGKIVDFIVNKIHDFPHRNAPSPLKHLGDFYIFYKANKRTTWYIFFEKRDKKYIITSIFNNYCEEVRFL